MEKIYLAGEFVSTQNQLAVKSPYTGKEIAQVAQAGEAEIERAIGAAEKAKVACRELPGYKRAEILRKIATEIIDSKIRLAEVLCMESGKPIRYAIAEVERAADTFLIASEESTRLPKQYLALDRTPAGNGKEGIVHYFPAGIIAAITPFNFPLNLVAHKVAPALAAGCPVILKPASSTPLSALLLAKIIDQTDWPKGGFSVLPCNRENGNGLVTDSRIAVLSFTGSPEIGWKMKEQAGKKKVVLELGGNAGVIINEDADLYFAIQRCLVGGFAYSGQICIHAQRIFVHEKIADEFFTRFVEGVKKIKSGDPMLMETEISSMIDEQNAIRVEAWVNEAVSSGAKVLCGGKREGNFYVPTVITNTSTRMKVNCEEVFGPVVVAEKIKNAEEGFKQINDSRFGLQAGIFTNDQRILKRALHELEVGGVICNDVPTFRIDNMPYGGVKDSGLGREGVEYAIRDFLEPRILVW